MCAQHYASSARGQGPLCSSPLLFCDIGSYSHPRPFVGPLPAEWSYASYLASGGATLARFCPDNRHSWRDARRLVPWGGGLKRSRFGKHYYQQEVLHGTCRQSAG
jgi:hypothetical protein